MVFCVRLPYLTEQLQVFIRPGLKDFMQKPTNVKKGVKAWAEETKKKSYTYL